MSFGKHGRIGANIYILLLAIGVIPPGLKVLNTLGVVYFLIVALLLSLGAGINTKAIIRNGGSATGEMMGLVSGLLALIAIWGAAKIWIVMDGSPVWTDMPRLVAAAVVSFSSALICRSYGAKNV